MAPANDTDTDTEHREGLMEATYRALCEHGYADLTMSAIAEEADRSTALLHYHYDTKEGLLTAFLDYLFAEFRAEVESLPRRDPEHRLRELLDLLLRSPDEDHWELATALLEVRAQAPYQEPFREHLRAVENFLRERIAAIVAEGIKTGQFEPVDPDRTARLLLAAADGARTKRVTLGDEIDPAIVRSGLDDHIDAVLLAGGGDAE
jgi:AcrR family transcriptional regulator